MSYPTATTQTISTSPNRDFGSRCNGLSNGAPVEAKNPVACSSERLRNKLHNLQDALINLHKRLCVVMMPCGPVAAAAQANCVPTIHDGVPLALVIDTYAESVDAMQELLDDTLNRLGLE